MVPGSRWFDFRRAQDAVRDRLDGPDRIAKRFLPIHSSSEYPSKGFDRRAHKYQLTSRIGLQDQVAADIGYDSVEALALLLVSTRPHDIRHIATDRNDAQGTIDLLEGRRHTFEPMPGVVGKAQAKATSRLLARLDPLAKGLEKRPPIIGMQ